MSLLNRSLQEKNTPVNDDYFFIADSANGELVKYILWSDIVSLLSGGVSDGDKGDITVSGAGTVWTIDNGAVTAAKTSITGTPDGTKYLRDDFSWQTVTGGSGLTHGEVMGRISLGI
jgi:hypothetical protein